MTRHPRAAIVAVLVTFGLFYTMQALTQLDQEPPGGHPPAPPLVWQTSEPVPEPTTRPPLPRQEAPPPPAPRTHLDDGPVLVVSTDVDDTRVPPTPLDPVGPISTGSAALDTPCFLLTAGVPRYPTRAGQRAGWVLVEYDVDAGGRPGPARVVDAEPPRLFDRAAVRAARGFRYRPAFENGAPRALPGRPIHRPLRSHTGGLAMLRSILIATLAAAFLAGPALARDPEREPPKTRKEEALSKRTYEALNKANEALQAEDFRTAESHLNALLNSGRTLNSHEQSMIQQTFGYSYSSQEKYPQAIKAFEKALALGGLPDTAALNTQFNLGQLYMMNEQYEKGITILTDWFGKATNPPASAYMLMANAHAQRAAGSPESEEKRHYREAWKWAKQGLAKMDKPREPWMRLGAQLNLTLDDWKTASHWLEQLVRRWPKETYLKQLTAVYGQLDQARKALIAMELAEMEGYLTESKELVRLAQLYLYNETPYKAAVLLEKHMADGTVERNEDNYELLANAWTMSRDYEKALDPLEKAASRSGDGKLWVRLGQLHLDGERWEGSRCGHREGHQQGRPEEPRRGLPAAGHHPVPTRRLRSGAALLRSGRPGPEDAQCRPAVDHGDQRPREIALPPACGSASSSATATWRTCAGAW